MDQLTTQVEKLEGQVFDLQTENQRLSQKLKEREQKEEEMKTKLQEAQFNAKLAKDHSDRTEQYTRLWNLKILYVPEKEGQEVETPEESKRLALKVFHDLLGLRNITPLQIDACHRVGEGRQGNIRPLIVRFVSRKVRLEVLKARKRLKGVLPKVIIVDDLAKSNYALFRVTKDHPGTLRCWTRDGRIFAQSLDHKIFQIGDTRDLSQLSIDLEAPPSFSHSQRANRSRQWSSIFASGGLRERERRSGPSRPSGNNDTTAEEEMEQHASPV